MRYTGVCLIALLFLVGLVTQGNAANIKVSSTSFGANFNRATSYNDNYHSKDSIKSAENYGYQADMKIAVAKSININLGFNYVPMSVTEIDPGVGGFPMTEYSRTNYPYWYSYYSQYTYYKTGNVKSKITGKEIFVTSVDYVYHMYYINLNLGIEWEPIQTGRIRPFVSAGITPAKFEQRGYLETDVTANYEDATGKALGKWHYKLRAHNSIKHRGYIFNGFVSGGVDFMVTDIVGLQVMGRYFKTMKDNERNRITGWYNIAVGVVFRQL